jgi:adenylate kinase family enzyme
MLGQRISIIGKTGSGKSTLCRQLGAILGLPAIELDSLFWRSDWQPAPEEEFRQKLLQVLREYEAWVIDGNYNNIARPLIWEYADTVIWLDYPLHVTWRRLFKRTLIRTITREPLWETNNRENLWQHLFTDKSLFLHSLKQRRNHNERYLRLMNAPEYAHIQFIHHQNPQSTQAMLNALRAERNLART